MLLVDAKAYTAHGYRWFDRYDEEAEHSHWWDRLLRRGD
jgi:hypothetical protein